MVENKEDITNFNKEYDNLTKAVKDEDKKEIDEKEKLKNEHEKSLGFKNNNQDEWKKNYAINPNIIEYGNGQADLIDFGIFDTNGNILTSIPNDREIILKSKVVFNEKIIDPIFTMTVKDFKGLDMMGTNTLIEKIVTGTFEKGDTAIIEFKQKISLAPNKYTLSFSCTHFDGNGELEVLSRKYDALLVEITSNKDTVGLYRLDSDINIIKTKGAN